MTTLFKLAAQAVRIVGLVIAEVGIFILAEIVIAGVSLLMNV